MSRSSIKETWSIFWHALGVAWQLVKSARFVRRVRMPVVTIWGGTQAAQESEYAQQAFAFSQKLVEHDISVLTGGGPGIMQAANCGAASVHKESDGKLSSLGIGVSFVDKEYTNPCVPVMRVGYFFLRKWLLIRYSLAFIVFPGGVGTMDELFELLNFMKHNKVPHLPVILIGRDYWQPIIDWFHKKALKEGFVQQYQVDLLMVTDDLDHAFEMVKETCEKFKEYMP